MEVAAVELPLLLVRSIRGGITVLTVVAVVV